MTDEINGRVDALRRPDAAARRPTRHEPLFLQSVDSLGEIKIKLRQTALAVG